MQRLMLYNMLDLFSLKLNKMDRKRCNTILRFIWSMNQFNFSSSEYWILDKPSPPSKWKEIFINRALPPLTTVWFVDHFQWRLLGGELGKRDSLDRTVPRKEDFQEGRNSLPPCKCFALGRRGRVKLKPGDGLVPGLIK